MMIFKAMYNECIYESSYSTISLHRTREGAEKAIADHKQERIEHYTNIFKDELDEDPLDYIRMEDWRVEETELLD